MKKVLFATTALIATAGVASADITLTGSASIGIQSVNSGNQTATITETDFNIIASGTADNGYTFGAQTGIDTQRHGETGAADANANQGDAEAYVAGPWGRITVGAVDAATDGTGIGDIGHQGLGVDDVAERNKLAGNGTGNTAGADIVYTGSFAGAGVTVSYSSVSEDTGVMLSFAVDALDIKVGVQNNRNSASDTDTTTNLTVGTTVGGISLTAYMEQFDDDDANTTTDGYGVFASYAMDAATTISVAYADNDAVADAAYGVGMNYNLGGGLALNGGVASVSDNTVWDLGLSMSF